MQLQDATAPRDAALSRFAPLERIVQCPISRGPLRLVSAVELMNRIADADKSRVGAELVGAFVSEEACRAYAIRGSVVNFVESESIQLVTAPSRMTAEQPDDEEKLRVRRWYDEFGWQRNEAGDYYDSVVFSQNAPTGNGLYELLSHLRVLERLSGGEWLIDAASGAIAHPEYLTYSWFYEHRVCVDFSAIALREAAAKLRPTDYCCQADICRLPFRDDVFQGGISGYTIQHFPESQQAIGVRELYRVLDRGAHLCFFTDVEYARSHELIRRALRLYSRMLMSLNATRFSAPAPTHSSPRLSAPHALYFLARNVKWWRELGASMTPYVKVEALRLLTRNEFQRLFGESNRAARMLQCLETSFPRVLAQASAYCLVDLQKPRDQGHIS